jgi:hypothetical protein
MVLHIHIPQILTLGLMLLSTMLSICDHGKVDKNAFNAWYVVIGNTVLVCLLVWGGFFHA